MPPKTRQRKTPTSRVATRTSTRNSPKIKPKEEEQEQPTTTVALAENSGNVSENPDQNVGNSTTTALDVGGDEKKKQEELIKEEEEVKKIQEEEQPIQEQQSIAIDEARTKETEEDEEKETVLCEEIHTEVSVTVTTVDITEETHEEIKPISIEENAQIGSAAEDDSGTVKEEEENQKIEEEVQNDYDGGIVEEEEKQKIEKEHNEGEECQTGNMADDGGGIDEEEDKQKEENEEKSQMEVDDDGGIVKDEGKKEIEKEENEVQKHEVTEFEGKQEDEVDNDGEEVEGAGGENSVTEAKGENSSSLPVMEERTKQKDFEIFVGGIERSAVEEDLRKVFSEVGEVVEVRLAKRMNSEENKGFAFIRFATIEQAKRAVSELKFPVVNGKVCGVTRNNNNETLYIRNICKTWTTDDLMKQLESIGIDNLDHAHLIDDADNKGHNKGYAFLEFNTHADALAAFSKLQKKDIFFGTDVSIDVAFSKSAAQPDEELMVHVKSVFLDGLPSTWNEEMINEHLKKYGEIEKIELARNLPTAKRKDFAFICFTTRDAALACIDGINKDGIGIDGEKIMAKASLRKPLGPRKQLGRSGGREVNRSYTRDFTKPRGSPHVPFSSSRGQTPSSRGRGHASSNRGSYGGRGHYSSGGQGPGRREDFSGPFPRSRDAYDAEYERHLVHSYGLRHAENSYTGGPSRGNYGGYPAAGYQYPSYPSHVPYAGNAYSAQYDHYDTQRAPNQYPSLSGTKRPYSTYNDGGSYPTHAMSRPEMKTDVPRYQGALPYDSYSGAAPGAHDGYRRPGPSYGAGSSDPYYPPPPKAPKQW